MSVVTNDPDPVDDMETLVKSGAKKALYGSMTLTRTPPSKGSSIIDVAAQQIASLSLTDNKTFKPLQLRIGTAYTVNETFQRELNATAFTIFHPIADLGYYAWAPRPSPPPNTAEDGTFTTHGQNNTKNASTTARRLQTCTKQDIMERIRLDERPPLLVHPISSLTLPHRLERDQSTHNHNTRNNHNYNRQQKRSNNNVSKKSVTYMNTFPNSCYEVASLHVASHHRGNPSNHTDKTSDTNDQTIIHVDFCFGGSTMEFLSRKLTGKNVGPYHACMIPGTTTVLVAKRKSYQTNLSDVGFQFERFVTASQAPQSLSNVQINEHMQLMRVGNFHVFFTAEADAIRTINNDTQTDHPSSDTTSSTVTDIHPVEIKALQPKQWGTKVMLQMISSGSPVLCHGSHQRGFFNNVELHSLSTVSSRALERRSVTQLESSILDGMRQLQDVMMEAQGNADEDVLEFCLAFDENGKLRASPVETTSMKQSWRGGKKPNSQRNRGPQPSPLLPKPSVTKELIQYS